MSLFKWACLSGVGTLVRVDAHGVRQLPKWQKHSYQEDGAFESVIVEDVLLIPMHDEKGGLWNVQAIFPEFNEALGRCADNDLPDKNGRRPGIDKADHSDVAAAGTGVRNRTQGTGQAEACPAQPPLIGRFLAKKKRRLALVRLEYSGSDTRPLY